jgi:hypothetical protein
MCCETLWSCLSFQEPARHTKRPESRAEQHYRGAAVRNSAAWAKERPPGKNVIWVHARTWNRDIPTQIADVPNFRKGKPVLVLVYVAHRYEYRPLPIFIFVPVPFRANTRSGQGTKIVI